jgi:hypothetical protein
MVGRIDHQYKKTFAPEGEIQMKQFALLGLTTGLLLFSMICTASTQSYNGDRPRYRGPSSPRPYYRGHFYQGPGYYRPGRYRTWNGCQRGWTVQDGLCKPYRGY